MTKPASIHFAVPVWGEQYIENWLRYSLPCQLSANNLPAVSALTQQQSSFASNQPVYHIFTTVEGQTQIRASSLFQRLSILTTVVFHSLESIQQSCEADRNLWRKYADNDWKKYAVKMACLTTAMQAAHQSKGVLIPLMSDIFVSDGGFRYLVEQALTGKKLVLVGSMRALDVPFLSAMKPYVSTDETLTISGPALLRHTLANLHPQCLKTNRYSAHFNSQWCDYMYWHQAQVGIIQRGVFCYPFLIDCQTELSVPPGYTIDTCPFVDAQTSEQAFEPSEVHVVTSPANCMVMTVSTEDEFDHVPTPPGVFNPLQIATFIHQNSFMHHQEFLRHPVIYGDESSANMQQLMTRCEQDYQAVKASLNFLQQSPGMVEQLSAIAACQALGDSWLAEIPDAIEQALLSSDSKPLYLFGSGVEAQALLHILPLRQRLSGLIDNDLTRVGQHMYDVAIVSPDALPEHAVVVCASAKHHEAMQQQLEQMYQSAITIINPYIQQGATQ